MHRAEYSTPTQAVQDPWLTSMRSPLSPWWGHFQPTCIAVAIGGWFTLLSTLSVEPTAAQEQAPSDRHGTQSLSQNDEHAVEPEDEHAHDETPALGEYR